MILSMTGYGKAESQINNQKLIVEVRGLNSKSMDMNCRIAPELRDKELDIRTMTAQKLERGKVDVNIWFEGNNADSSAPHFAPINKEAFCYYYQQMQAIAAELEIGLDANIANAILRIPEVMSKQETTTVSNEQWETVKQTIGQALEQFVAFRTQEGAALERMFTEKLDGIYDLLQQVEPFEKGRVEKIKQHLLSNLDKLSEETKQKTDYNRLEAELIYYLEKLDITEEKVRLTNHIKYFRETMQGDGSGVGKKLGFIAQEMGREINTLGSKSNQSEMQIIVVKMKDILEQIKEQVLNVL